VAITSIKTGSSFKTLTKYDSFLAGNPSYVPPSFESIQTYTVGSGGAADITFSSIASTYKHLQIRVMTRSTAAISLGGFRLEFNGDTTSANYKGHYIYGDGASAGAGTSSYIGVGLITGASATANVFGTSIIDILDYADTNKYKTVKSLAASDVNGSGELDLFSGLWLNTSAVTSIRLFAAAPNFAQYSSFALYGIKGA
jgi:hypothetical protein